MSRAPYLKNPQHTVIQRRRTERRLNVLYGLTILFFGLLLVIYFPKTTAQRNLLLQEGRRRFQTKILQPIAARGIMLRSQPAQSPTGPYNLTYELPPGLIFTDFQSWLEALLTQNGFQFRRSAARATGDQYKVLVSYYDLPIGSLTFQKPGTIAPPPTEQPVAAARLAIVIDDFGNSNNEIVQGFLNLELPITVSIIPGHQYSRWVAEQAKSAGKEIIVHMPMEPEGNAYQGGEDRYLLSTKLSESEIQRRIEQALAELPEARGMNNHMGSRFTADAKLMSLVMQSLKRKGIYFIDSLTSPRSVAYETARADGVPAGLRTVFLDNIRDKSEIRAQFDRALTIAQRSGKALVIGHVHPETLAALQEIEPTLSKLNVSVIFASQIVE